MGLQGALKDWVGRKVRIGLIRDIENPGEFERLLGNPQFRQLLGFTNISLQNLDRLRPGRIDWLIDDPVTVQYLAQRNAGDPVQLVQLVQLVQEIMSDGSLFMRSK